MILILSLITGIMAGIYFTFSFVVVDALKLMPNNEGARAMNRINDVIVKTVFLPLFFVSTIWYFALLFRGVIFTSASEPNFVWASVIYIVGMFGVTVFGNVPLNNKLKSRAKDPQKLMAAWDEYGHKWVVLNHVRVVSCTVAFVLLNYGI